MRNVIFSVGARSLLGIISLFVLNSAQADVASVIKDVQVSVSSHDEGKGEDTKTVTTDINASVGDYCLYQIDADKSSELIDGGSLIAEVLAINTEDYETPKVIIGLQFDIDARITSVKGQDFVAIDASDFSDKFFADLKAQKEDLETDWYKLHHNETINVYIRALRRNYDLESVQFYDLEKTRILNDFDVSDLTPNIFEIFDDEEILDHDSLRQIDNVKIDGLLVKELPSLSAIRFDLSGEIGTMDLKVRFALQSYNKDGVVVNL